MHKLTVFYTEPANPEGFESHYERYHMPLVRAWPQIRAIRMSRFSGDPRGNPPTVYLMAEILFDDEESLGRALRSEPGVALVQDLTEMSRKFDVEARLMVGTEQEIA
ncbi:MAG: EthD family reductase [Actinomycetota bacterium]|nr:EthD family reductase [Actinomycetota bacterium]